MRPEGDDIKEHIKDIIIKYGPNVGEIFINYVDVIKQHLSDTYKINESLIRKYTFIKNYIRITHGFALDDSDEDPDKCAFIKIPRSACNLKSIRSSIKLKDIIDKKGDYLVVRNHSLKTKTNNSRRFIASFKPMDRETVKEYKERIIRSVDEPLYSELKEFIKQISVAITVAGYHRLYLTEPKWMGKRADWTDCQFVYPENV